MITILLIETALEFCSVALVQDRYVISVREAEQPRTHAGMLAAYIDDMMNETGKKFRELDAIAVSKGPGSYTGLRIGTSTAKGIAFASNLPLIAVSTLRSMASRYKQQHPSIEADFLTPVIDARRMEVYTASFNHDLEITDPVRAEIVNEKSFNKEYSHVLFGDGADKLADFVSTQNNLTIDTDFRHNVLGMTEEAFQKFENKAFENVTTFEPFYLKDFVSPGMQKP